jgi:hypothetical protein
LLHLVALKDTHALDWASLDKGSVHLRELYLTTHSTHKRHTSMSPAGFEPAIPTSERPQTGTLDRASPDSGQ